MNTLESRASLGLDALMAGADQACCSASRQITRELSAEWGDFTLYRTLFDDAVSFMAIDGGRRGTLSQNRIENDAILSGAKTCLASARAADPDDCWKLAPAVPEKMFESGPVTCDEELLFERCRELLKTIRERFPKIMVESLIATHELSESCALFSTGSRFFTREGLYGISLMFNAHEGEKTSSFFGTGVQMNALDRPLIEMGSLEQDLEMVSRQIVTQPMENAFEGTVLMMPGCFGEYLSSCVGTFASDTVLIENTSLWKDKIGETVANPALTVRMAPFHPDVTSGERYTSEGYLSEDYSFIEDGILKSFSLSDYAARKTGQKRSPNQSMNLIVTPGTQSFRDIIRSINRGILVGRVSGGRPAVNGDFSAVAKNAFLIENGEIGHALSETMMNGNLAELLMNIRALSSETVKDGATVLPWAAFDHVRISGK